MTMIDDELTIVHASHGSMLQVNYVDRLLNRKHGLGLTPK
jgi:hypothetical protein